LASAGRGRILGSEFAGVVEAVGAAVVGFAVGDHVFGDNGLKVGAHAEFICVRESARIAHKPTGLKFDEAAPVCDGALNALACLRQAHLRKAEGPRLRRVRGHRHRRRAAGQVLRRRGHRGVRTKNVELVSTLGANAVIDYMQDDFTKNGETYDVIFDAVGKHSFKQCRGSMKRGGSYLATDGFQNLILALWTSSIGDKRVRFSITSPMPTKKDVLFLKELIEAGRYRAVVDRRYPLEDVVEASRYVETEQKTGNVF
jgi:NADPH:quinone reductase-like Zn-dependent oxidoreductase